MELKVMGMEENLCRCGTKSAVVDEDLEYFTPLKTQEGSFQSSPVAGSSSSAPLPVPEPLPPADQSLPPSGNSDQETLGADPHLPSGYIVISLWFLNQSAWLLPRGYFLITFKKCPML